MYTDTSSMKAKGSEDMMDSRKEQKRQQVGYDQITNKRIQTS